MAEVGGDGAFAFEGVPPETVDINVRVKGYHLSEANVSFERLNRLSLEGIVDADITGLRVQLDPGPGDPPRIVDLNNEGRQKLFDHVKRTRESRIQGAPTPDDAKEVAGR